MIITSYKKFLFIKEEHVTDRNGDLRLKSDCEKYMVSPSSTPQHVPDWIRDTDLFRLAVEDGAITEHPVAQPVSQ